MLSSAPIIRAVADRVRHWNLAPVLVIDPGMVAKSGDRGTLDAGAMQLRRCASAS